MNTCAECGVRFSPRATGAWIEVTGWIVTRARGGANAVRDKRATGRGLCPSCGKLRELGVTSGQRDLFPQ